MPIKKRFRVDPLVIYQTRPKLDGSSLSVLRLRVAIRVLDRLFAHVEHRISEAEFPRWALRRLDRLAKEGMPHMLDDELRDVLHGWQRGETYPETYVRALNYSTKRIINIVAHGGRKDAR